MKNKQFKQVIAASILQISSMFAVALPDNVSNDNLNKINSSEDYIPQRVLNVFSGAKDVCAKFDGTSGNTQAKKQLKELFNVLQKSSNGKFISDFALTASLPNNDSMDDGRLWACFTDLTDNFAEYYQALGILVAGENKIPEQLVINVAHEMRHFWQEVKGFGGIHYAVLPMALSHGFYHSAEADAETFAASIGWELKQSGETTPWDSYRDKSQCREDMICYATFAETFEKATKGSNNPVQDGASAMFSQYMKDEEMQRENFFTLMENRKLLDVKEEENPDHKENKELLYDFFRSGGRDAMGEMSNGRNYLKSGNVFNKLYPVPNK